MKHKYLKSRSNKITPNIPENKNEPSNEQNKVLKRSLSIRLVANDTSYFEQDSKQDIQVLQNIKMMREETSPHNGSLKISHSRGGENF